MDDRFITKIENPLSFHQQEMYPKVKVRDLEEDDEHGYDSFSIHDSSFPVEEQTYDSQPLIVRIPTSDISSSEMPVIPPCKGAEKINKKKDFEENKVDNRPNSILRPRAVLSSPDNDGMVRSKNKSRTEQHSGLKNHNSCQNRHVQCKVIPRPVVFGSPVNTKRELKEAPHVKHGRPGTKRSVTAGRTGKEQSLLHVHSPAV